MTYACRDGKLCEAMVEFIQVVTSVDSAGKAEEIARKLLEGRLAACVQVLGPMKSRYRWEGRIEEAEG